MAYCPGRCFMCRNKSPNGAVRVDRFFTKLTHVSRCRCSKIDLGLILSYSYSMLNIYIYFFFQASQRAGILNPRI